ncbi:hypothetical protein I6A60_08340 [Frankia sp. AgB1.9]|uniref:hypothetical protein n=1 Tax=unclassified Frankia TaxID=2632575 RepID=UPI001931706B|nr:MULTISPECIES: hypothetical protein [unclassified Frankia]MBL7489541.1 hypothetical protein [Frankia sp. AgW1.1]MBL7547880.1 hypothetical protein [Frankia sp. AgB1.9]MBL7621396.1 hypothetical protein [Frankia sp. AgB1.8]
MRTLGDVLAAMVTCGERWPSVHAELVHRYDPGAAADARRSQQVRDLDGQGAGNDAGPPPGPGTVVAPPIPAFGFVPVPAAPAPGEDATDPVVRRGRLLAGDGMLRVEWPDEDEVTVVHGELWRRRRGEEISGTGTVGAASARPGSPRRPGVVVREQLLVRPWLLLAWLRPRLTASVQVGGRASTRLTAVPRPGARPPVLSGLADGAQRFDLVVDDETGVVVELAAFFRGRLIERVALRRLTVGDTADPRLFDLAALDLGAAGRAEAPRSPAGGGSSGEAGPAEPKSPGPPNQAVLVPSRATAEPAGVGESAAGEPVLPARPRPLAELAGEVDFRLCVPVGRAFVGRIERRPEGAVVVAFPAANNGELLTVSQSAGAGIADTAGWERIRLPDGTPASWWPPDGLLLQGHLVFDRADTRIWVRGVDRHAMTALALSLHPVR